MVDFQKEVIDKSFEMPVVVDFWAPWCGPCRMLTPIIEKIAEEQAGQWSLVKLNTEEQPDISDAFGIRSIPNVKLFYHGEVIHEFLGALPRQRILEWLEQAVPNEGRIALDDLLNKPEPPMEKELEELLARYPETEEIRLILAQLLLWDNPAKADELLAAFNAGSIYFKKTEFLRDIIAFLQYETADVDLLQIQEMFRASQIEKSIPKILEIIAKDEKAAEGTLAKATLGLFSLLGTDHELTKQYRKQLDMYLWK